MSTSENGCRICETRRSSIIAGYSAVAISAFLIIIKAIAYYMSGSMSVLSSLIDSSLDSMISIMALASVYYASKPADSDHRWGHGKMEAVSALFQAAIIAGGGVFLVVESLHRFAHIHEMKNHTVGIYVMAISIVFSILLVWIQRRSLAKSESLAIEADSVHYSSDVLINTGALIVIFLTMKGAPYWLDPIFAIGVAIFMGKLAHTIAKKALSMLLDKELPSEERNRIINIIESHNMVLDWHDLRTSHNGIGEVVIVDIEVDTTLSFLKAHEITVELEEQILKLYPKADVIIHVDPEGDRTDARHRVEGVHK